MTSERDTHLFAAGPKRILALDGGGIRGILTLQFLSRIEAILAARTNNPDIRLSDYFDLIGGTSTGSIIAAGLALGLKVEQLESLYHELGNEVFASKHYRDGLFVPKFSAKPLKRKLKSLFGNVLLGGEELRTGLMVALKRMDSGSPWIISNNPRGKYFHQRKGSSAVPNSEFLLRDIVRASTAAPTYFEPELIEVAKGMEAKFVDGGISPHNNPSLQLLLMATAKAYELHWQTGADKLLMVSCGTGASDTSIDKMDGVVDYIKAQVGAGTSMGHGIQGLKSLMNDASALNETMLQWLSHSPNAREIDREIGNLQNDAPGGHHLLTYIRYQSWLDADWLSGELGLDYKPKEIKRLRKMEKPENMEELVKIGELSAERLITDAHLPAAFDI